MKNKIPAIVAFTGAPFLCIDFLTHIDGERVLNDSLSTRIFDILYLSGWICSIAAFKNMEAAGSGRSGKVILNLQLIFLSVALASDIIGLLQIPIPGNVFFYIDLFWPISNTMMIVTGIAILAAGKLPGWKKFAPLIVGLWLPLLLTLKIFISTEAASIAGGLYSAIMWTLMAYVAFSNEKTSIGNKNTNVEFA